MSELADDIVPEVNAALQQPFEHSLYAKLQNMAEKVAATRLGQYLLEKGDSMLRTMEYTAKRSLPKETEDGQTLRPLPWLPFLALIFLLRLVRFWLSLAALLIGNSPVTAKDMVYFMQTRRRKLRAIRMHGLKLIREQQLAQTNNNHYGLLQKIYKALLLPMCCSKRARNNEADFNVQMLRERWTKADAQQPVSRQLSQKRSSSKEAELDMATEEEVNQQLSFNELLAKYAEMSSEDDSTYEPPATGEDSEMSSSDSCEDTETEEELANDTKKEKIVVDAESDVTEHTNLHMPKPIKMEVNSDTESTQNTRLMEKNDDSERSPQKKLDVKSTPGHVSAAITKISQSTILSNTAAAGEHESNTTQSSPLKIEIPTQNLSNSVTARVSTPPYETNKLGSASSCEDIFYSPIGSPTEFNLQQPFTFNSTVSVTGNQDLPKAVQDNIENIEPSNGNAKISDNQQQQQQQQQPSQINSKYHKNHTQAEQKQNHTRHPSANNRFRGRYRKKFDAM